MAWVLSPHDPSIILHRQKHEGACCTGICGFGRVFLGAGKKLPGIASGKKIPPYITFLTIITIVAIRIIMMNEIKTMLPRLNSKNGKGFPEEGEVGAEGLWFRRAPREAKKIKQSVPLSVSRVSATGYMEGSPTSSWEAPPKAVRPGRNAVGSEPTCPPWGPRRT